MKRAQPGPKVIGGGFVAAPRAGAVIERRPHARSGWREQRSKARSVGLHLDALAHSVWTRGGIFVISALEIADYPDGSGATGPQWHLSMSRWTELVTSRCTDEEVRQTLAGFGVPGAEEDNHHPGDARHFWVPVDPARRVDCECKATEKTIVEPDGYRWTTPEDACAGCDFERMFAGMGVARPCQIHHGGDVVQR